MLYSHTIKLVRFYQGVDGLKTGYTEPAGYCLTATAKKNNMRLISVVMGEPDSKTRNAEVTSMLDYGYSQYKSEQLLNKKNIIAKVEIEKGKNKYVEIIPKTDVQLLTKKTEKLGKITYNLKLDEIKAPIKKGNKVGSLEILNDNKIVNTIDVTVKEDVKKANFLELLYRYFGDMVSGTIKF